MYCSNRFSFQECLVLAVLLAGIKNIHVHAEEEVHKFLQCSNQTGANSFRLYLTLDELVMDCMLVGNAASARQYRNKLELYKSAGLRPKMEIYNRTNSFAFTFTLNMETTTWRVIIPRHNITINTGTAPVDQWYVEISMFHGFAALNAKADLLETLKGTLLDVAREPILQWTIGEEISPQDVLVHQHLITKLQVTQSPCASDVAVMAPLFAPEGHHTGVVLSVTMSSFTSSGRWFNVTKSLCNLINALCTSGCRGITLLNLKLTNCHLFLLTNRGLFVSQDLLSPVTGPLNFTLLFHPALAQIDYSSATLWFSSECITNRLYFSDDYVSLISNEGSGMELNSKCVYSGYPFKDWYACQVAAVDRHGDTKHRYLSFLYDRYQHTGLLLSYIETNAVAMLSVFTILKSGLKNEAKITPTFLPDYYPSGIFLRNTHVIIYGQEVWASSDRGASFQKLLSLKGDAVVDVLSCNYNSLLVLLTARGRVFIMRAGLERYSILNVVLTGATFLQCDHMGTLMAVKLDGTSPGGLSHRILPIETLIQEDVQPFPTTLALQYISPVSVLLHEFPLKLPTAPVSNLGTYHIGKIFSLRHGGQIAITDVFQTHFAPGFVYCARGDVLQPVNGLSIYEEPLQKFNLLNQKSDEKGTLAILTPQTTRGMPPPSFEPRHVGMTVVSPGLSSFIIVEVRFAQALTRVTMPDPLFNRNLNAGRWLLFDTRPGNWSLHEGPCLHTLESVENLRHNALVRINVRETLSFTFKALKTDHSFSLTRFKKRMKVALTNPTAMRVTARHYWDKTNNHILTLTVYSHVCKKATTLVTVFIPEASLVCSRSSFTFTLENACPEGLSIVYLPSQPISDHEWIYGDPEDENDNQRLFDLPVNYRPPSQLGVLIPTTDNIYNADPSKPRPRQHYPVSKNTGRYKQCAGKASAAECGCTDALKVSPLAINSDCRQRVLRMIYPLLNFNITLFLRRANQADQPLRSPYFVTVTEVNNRTNWAVTGTHHTTTMTMMRRYLKDGFNQTFYNPKGLQISCYGSELFHFRISVIPGVVLCDLVEEVQIYVDKAPLAFPAAYVISCMTAIALGGFLVLGFLLKNISPPTPRNLRALLTRGRAKVAPETEDENQD